MAVFGGYETVRELIRSGLASSHVARKASGGADCFVIKAYEPASAEADPQRFQQEVENFLDGARAQKECSDRKAPHWASLHEMGTMEGGAYFVTDLQPRSVERLIHGKAKLDGNALCQIAGSIVQGLIELREACHRPHGNLKPTNILLTGKGLADMQVLLTDPAGGKQLPNQASNAADLHAIGELIYVLVMQRPGRAIGGWQAPDSEEWKRLGKKGADWRGLCNRLLNQNLDSNIHQLEDLLEDLQKLRGGRGGAKKILIPAVAALVLAGAGVGAYIAFVAPPPTPVVEPKEWVPLCTAFATRVEPLLSAKEGGGLSAWEKDPYLSRVVMPMLGSDSQGIPNSGNPRAILNRFSGDVLDWTKEEERKKVVWKKDMATRVAAAQSLVDRWEKAMTSKDWPALTAIKDANEAFHARGWTGAATYLKARLPFPNKDVAAWVGEILVTQVSLAKVDAAWKNTQALCGVIKDKGWGGKSEKDASLQKIDDYVLAETRAAGGKVAKQSLDELAAKLEELSSDKSLLNSLARILQSDRAKNVDMAQVHADPPFKLPLTDESIRTGVGKIQNGDYDPLVDLRQAWEPRVAGDLNDLGPKVTGLTEDVSKEIGALAATKWKDKYDKELNGVLAEGKQSQEKLGALKAALAKLSAKAMPVYDRGTRKTIDSGMKEIDDGLKDLNARINTTRQGFQGIVSRIIRDKAGSLKEVQDRLANVKSISPTGNPDIDAAWVAQCKALRDKESTGEGLFDKSERLRKFLQDLEGLFPQDLGAQVDKKPWNDALLTTCLSALRKDGISSALSSVTAWDKVFLGQPDPDFSAHRDELVKDYLAWRTGVAGVIPALNQVQDLLNAGYLLSEKPAPLTTTLGEFYANLEKTPPVKDQADPSHPKPIFRHAAVQAAAKPIIDRMAALQQASTSSDPQALLTAVNAGKQGQFEAARAAWVRLGTLGKAWPAKSDDLRQEVECRKILAALYGLVSDPARKTALQEELTKESRRRWEAYFVTRLDPKDIEDSAAKMAGFGVAPADRASLSPLAQFRLDMYDLLYAVGPAAGAVDDETVRKAAAKFLDNSAKLPGDFIQKANLKASVDPLREVVTTKEETINLAQAGPAAIKGWQKDSDAGDLVVYSWPGHNQKLTFARVSPAGGKPSFLCATEVSAGLFLDVLTSLQKQAEIDKLLPKDGDLKGPRVWVRKAGALAMSDEWFPLAILPPALAGNKLFPANAVPEKPTAGHPIQQVSLAAAIYLANLMNCRLPTAGEWAAAYQVDKRATSQKPYNLRDKTWLVQKNHCVALEQAGDLVESDQFYPDAGIFWPNGATQKVGSQADVAADAKTDGYLWFSKVDSDPQGRVFQNLVGNVAEFVYEDPDALVALKAPTADTIRQFLGTGAAKARVIGGSALSAPAVAVDQAQALPAGVDCFSDVGFRLAFSAGREPLQIRLLRLLKAMQNQGYLAPLP
jgi:hypothetical protein